MYQQIIMNTNTINTQSVFYENCQYTGRNAKDFIEIPVFYIINPIKLIETQ